MGRYREMEGQDWLIELLEPEITPVEEEVIRDEDNNNEEALPSVGEETFGRKVLQNLRRN